MRRDELSAAEYVVRPRNKAAGAHPPESLEKLASVRELSGPTRGWVATLRSAARTAREGWETLAAELGPDYDVVPALVTEDGTLRYPTGLVTLRFASSPSDAAIESLARRFELELVQRSKFTTQQALFRPAKAKSVFLPDLAESLSTAKDVQASWLDAESAYVRQRTS